MSVLTVDNITAVSYTHLYYRQLKREMFALNDALEESEMNWQSLLTTLGSKYTANISYNLPRVLGQCQNRNVLQSKMEDMVAHVYTHASRGLDWLSTIITIAPLLGLLGTVTGMIGAFQVFGADGAVPTAITGGVGEALVATASGLCVAIVALCFHAAFTHHVDVYKRQDFISRCASRNVDTTAQVVVLTDDFSCFC